MKKKGYTLIELAAVMAILSIIFSLGFAGYKIYRNSYEEIQINQGLYEIEETLSYGEIYCRNEGKEGIFYIEEKQDGLEIRFKQRAGNNIKITRIPKVLTLAIGEGESTSIRSLTINNEGHIQPGTIKLKDSKGTLYELTVRVSVNLITIWQWEIIYGEK